jgi:hypothetical protein
VSILILTRICKLCSCMDAGGRKNVKLTSDARDFDAR